MAVTLSLFAGAGAQFFDNNGVILSGGLVYTYAAGTTTPLAAYTSNTGATALANPIVLDASGRVPTGEIWLTYGQGYKFTVKTSTGTLIGTYDNIPNAALPPLVNDAASIAYEQGASVTAGNFIIGQTYLITFIGTTNFQSIGAVSNTVGTYFIATGVGSGTGTAEFSRSVEAKLQETVSVKDFGAVGNGIADDSTAFANAFATSKKVYAPAGTYLVTTAIPSDTFLVGDYGLTIIKPLVNSNYYIFLAQSSSATTYLTNITFKDITFASDVATSGFSEFCHLVNLSGVKNVTIDHCIFTGFRGDGLYLGSGLTAGLERHNIDVIIFDCIFDGINNQNRNGISIIDGSNIQILSSEFKNITKTGMPAAIDIEPNAGATYAILKSISIANNTFDAIGGGSVINLNTNAVVLTSPVNGLHIANNTFKNTITSSTTIFLTTIEDLATVPLMDINISNNNLDGGLQPIVIWKCNGVTITENSISNSGQISLGNSATATLSIKNAIFSKNIVLNTSTIVALASIGTVENIELEGNILKPQDTVNHTRGILFWGNGVATTSTNVKISGNTFLKGTNQTLAINSSGHTYSTPKTNVYSDNYIDTGLSVAYSNQTYGTWTPVLTAVTPGDLAVVYSTQVGTYSKNGRLVTINFNIITTTWSYTTASGILRITGLPYPVSTSSDVVGSLYGAGWTLAGVSGMSCGIFSAGTNITLYLSRSGSSIAAISTTMAPSGTQQSYSGSISYITEF